MNVVEKLGTSAAYLLVFISWTSVTQVLAVVLTLAMITYYAAAAWNKVVATRQLKRKNENRIP